MATELTHYFKNLPDGISFSYSNEIANLIAALFPKRPCTMVDWCCGPETAWRTNFEKVGIKYCGIDLCPPRGKEFARVDLTEEEPPDHFQSDYLFCYDSLKYFPLPDYPRQLVAMFRFFSDRAVLYTPDSNLQSASDSRSVSFCDARELARMCVEIGGAAIVLNLLSAFDLSGPLVIWSKLDSEYDLALAALGELEKHEFYDPSVTLIR